MELTATICDVLVDVAVRNKHLPQKIRMEAHKDRMKKAEEEKAAKRAAMIEEMGRPEFAYGPHIIVPSEYDVSKFK